MRSSPSPINGPAHRFADAIWRASTMAHAGTMDLGQNVQSKPNGNPWPLLGLAVAVVAIIAAVWFASSAGLVGGQLAAKPADRSYDAIEAQRGALALSTDRGYDAIEAQRGTVAGRVQVCRAISPTTGFTVNAACTTADAAYVQATVNGGWSAAQYDVTRMIYLAPATKIAEPALDFKAAKLLAAAKAAQGAVVAPGTTVPSLPSGTFHAGNPAVGDPIVLLPGIRTIDIPVRRDRVGGP